MNKPIVWSYSFLSTFERCARQAQAKYVTKELPYVESPEAAEGNRVHKLMENYIKGAVREVPENYRPFVDRLMATPGLKYAEYSIGVTREWRHTEFFDRDVWGRAKLDAVVIDGENAVILDWKTGKVREDPFELEVQACLLKRAHPKLKNIMGAYVWFKENRYGEIRDLSETKETEEHIEKTMNDVSKCQWYPTKNVLCPWCTLSTCRYYKETRR